MAFLLINALKKLVIYSTQSTTILQNKLKSINAQILTLEAGSQHPGVIKDYLARISRELLREPEILAQSSPSLGLMGDSGLWSPTNGTYSPTAAGSHPADAISDADIEALFKQHCFQNTLSLGLAFGIRYQENINSQLNLIREQAEKEMLNSEIKHINVELPQGLDKTGMNKGSGGKKRTRSGLQSGGRG